MAGSMVVLFGVWRLDFEVLRDHLRSKGATRGLPLALEVDFQRFLMDLGYLLEVIFRYNFGFVCAG